MSRSLPWLLSLLSGEVRRAHRLVGEVGNLCQESSGIEMAGIPLNLLLHTDMHPAINIPLLHSDLLHLNPPQLHCTAPINNYLLDQHELEEVGLPQLCAN